MLKINTINTQNLIVNGLLHNPLGNYHCNRVILCILDGLGISNKNVQYNALHQSYTPTIDFLMRKMPSTLLNASGEDIGLPNKQIGNSEVGHMTIGSGRVIKQNLTIINDAIDNGDLAKSDKIKNLKSTLQNTSQSCHIIILLSDGGVHSHINHLFSFIKLLQNVKIKIHIITDGRDVSPKSALKYIKMLEEFIYDLQNSSQCKSQNSTSILIATICGRYYAMDRDNRTDRTLLAFQAMVYGNDDAKLFSKNSNKKSDKKYDIKCLDKAKNTKDSNNFNIKDFHDNIQELNSKLKSDTKSHKQFENIMIFDAPTDYINNQYNLNITDEFIIPSVNVEYSGIEQGDALIILNFRPDRMRQILDMFFTIHMTISINNIIDIGNKDIRDICKDISNPNIHTIINPITTIGTMLSYAFGMTKYSSALDHYIINLFPAFNIQNTLGQVLAKHNKTQLRIAETEKYAHVTFFFNAGIETPYKGEDRILIPSPKVQYYDSVPEMSATEITKNVIKAIKNEIKTKDNTPYDFICVNYANADMIGHTGNMKAAIQACQVLDESIKLLIEALDETIILLITSDHGNIECMFCNESQQPHTAHTINPVPFIYVSKNLIKNHHSLSIKGMSQFNHMNDHNNDHSSNDYDNDHTINNDKNDEDNDIIKENDARCNNKSLEKDCTAIITKSAIKFDIVNMVPKLTPEDKHKIGTLADIAPTVLDIMGIDKPNEMTGKSLINSDNR